jgi:hypothetical protein
VLLVNEKNSLYTSVKSAHRSTKASTEEKQVLSSF